MEAVSVVVAGLSLIAVGGFGALAWGYRGQRDQEREQVDYLRKQIAHLSGSPAPQSRALATVGARS